MTDPFKHCPICGLKLPHRGCPDGTLRGIDSAHTRANNENDEYLYSENKTFHDKLKEAERLFGETSS